MEKVKILLFTLMVALSVNLRAQQFPLRDVLIFSDGGLLWRANLYSDHTAEILGMGRDPQTNREVLEIPSVVFNPQWHGIYFKVTKIGNSAFKNSKFSSISFPSTVKILGDSAFYGASLEKITLQADLSHVGKYAFANCSSLRSVELPANLSKINNATFFGCKSLTTVKFPERLTEIGSYAFLTVSHCPQLSYQRPYPK